MIFVGHNFSLLPAVFRIELTRCLDFIVLCTVKVFNCLDMTEMETCDVINVVEYISPDSYEELAEEIIINSFL